MYTTVHKSRQFKKSTWKAGALSGLLSELLIKINSRQADVRLIKVEPGGTPVTIKGGPEAAKDVVDLPPGSKVLTAQFIRERGDSDIVSNVDILSLDMLTVDIVSLVFSVAADEYQIDVRARDTVLADNIFATVIEYLSLQEIAGE